MSKSTKSINKVEEILMRRDGLTRTEAHTLRLECAEAITTGEWDAINSYLGLEDDYIFDVLEGYM